MRFASTFRTRINTSRYWFSTSGNYYRLIVKVDYRAKLLMVKGFLTHKEYTRGGWKKWAL